jgi:hypothetical protein
VKRRADQILLTPQEARDLLALVQTAVAIRSAQLRGGAWGWFDEPLHRPNLEAEMRGGLAVEQELIAVLEPYTLSPSWPRT